MSFRRDGWALVLLTTSGVVTALACVAWALGNLGSPPPEHHVYLWMGAALMAMGAAFSVPLQPRLSMRVTLTPTACLVCASVLPAPWVVVCAAAGLTVARLLARRPRSFCPHKVVHNTSMDIIAAALASAVMFAFGIRPHLGEPAPTAPSLSRHLFGFLVAALVVVVFEELVTTTAVTLSTGRPFLVVLRGLWLTRLGVAVAEISIAGVVTVVTGLEKRALVALPVMMLILHLSLTYRLRVREERRAWEHLAALSDALTARDLDVVLHTAAGGAVDLFGARAADIELTGGRRLVRASQQGGVTRVVFDGPAAEAPDVAGPRSVVRHEIGGDANGVQGIVRLHLNGPRDALSVRERAALQAFAATLASSVDLAHAYGQLAAEARQHEAAATHDDETGIPNRAALLNRLSEMSGESCHTVVIRLENYHFLADAVGRDRASALLKTLADRLCQLPRDTTSAVARVGDVTFALVMGDVTTDIAYQRACWAVAELRREINVDGRRLVVRASAGMASGPPGPRLLDAAERVLWRAIRRGQDRLVSYQSGPVREWSLARELSHARMSISFEPIVDLVSDRIAMVQSTPRWLYSRHEVLTADDYAYQLVDDPDSLETLAGKVVARSLSAAATWRDALPDAALVVPVPAGALTPGFADTTRDLLREHAVAGTSLVLALGRPPQPDALDGAERMRQFGVRLLLDSYGSGHGGIESLDAATWSYLRLHPAYALDAGWQPARSVIRAAVNLASDLDLTVIAPGITTDDERRELAGLGCALGSGPLVGGEMFPSQLRSHAQVWQPTPLHAAARVLPLHRAGRTVPRRRG
ncbi:EAL domain-containing protein [Micromonospora sp. NPDC048930]|uniref:EAL domain-containing protein n=1 Tax=Micromonospora sp. NPDC048930 TaxID=3364261 RepID=UPI003712A63C